MVTSLKLPVCLSTGSCHSLGEDIASYGDFRQTEPHNHPELPHSVNEDGADGRAGEQRSCCCVHGHGKSWRTSARLQPLVLQVVLKTAFLISDALICLCGRSLLTFRDRDLLNDSRHARGHVALADIPTSTFTHLKQLFCNRIFTDKAGRAFNSDSDGLHLRRIRDDFKTVVASLASNTNQTRSPQSQMHGPPKQASASPWQLSLVWDETRGQIHPEVNVVPPPGLRWGQ